MENQQINQPEENKNLDDARDPTSQDDDDYNALVQEEMELIQQVAKMKAENQLIEKEDQLLQDLIIQQQALVDGSKKDIDEFKHQIDMDQRYLIFLTHLNDENHSLFNATVTELKKIITTQGLTPPQSLDNAQPSNTIPFSELVGQQEETHPQTDFDMDTFEGMSSYNASPSEDLGTHFDPQSYDEPDFHVPSLRDHLIPAKPVGAAHRDNSRPQMNEGPKPPFNQTYSGYDFVGFTSNYDERKNIFHNEKQPFPRPKTSFGFSAFQAYIRPRLKAGQIPCMHRPRK